MDELVLRARRFQAAADRIQAARIDKVPVQPRNSVALRQAKSGEESWNRVARRTHGEWKATEGIPVECGGSTSAASSQGASIGFEFWAVDTADFKGAITLPGGPSGPTRSATWARDIGTAAGRPAEPVAVLHPRRQKHRRDRPRIEPMSASCSRSPAMPATAGTARRCATSRIESNGLVVDRVVCRHQSDVPAVGPTVRPRCPQRPQNMDGWHAPGSSGWKLADIEAVRPDRCKGIWDCGRCRTIWRRK